MSRTAVSPSVRSVNAAPPVVNPHPVVKPIRVCMRHLCYCAQDTSVPLICSAASPPPTATACVCPHAFYLYHCYYQSAGCSPLLLHIRTLGRHNRNTGVSTAEIPCCYVSPFGTPLALLDLFFCCRRANHVCTRPIPPVPTLILIVSMCHCRP